MTGFQAQVNWQAGLNKQRHALESGVTRVNGVIASPYYILRDGDRLEYVRRSLPVMHFTLEGRLDADCDSNTVHRHEPPVANDPVKVLHIDREREFVVISKPGSVVCLLIRL